MSWANCGPPIREANPNCSANATAFDARLQTCSRIESSSPHKRPCRGDSRFTRHEGDDPKDRAVRVGHTQTAQLLGSDFARRTCCKPSRLVLVASPPSIAALLIGVEGGSQLEGPG